MIGSLTVGADFTTPSSTMATCSPVGDVPPLEIGAMRVVASAQVLDPSAFIEMLTSIWPVSGFCDTAALLTTSPVMKGL